MAGFLVKLDSYSIRFLSAFVFFFYAFLPHDKKVMFFLVSIFTCSKLLHIKTTANVANCWSSLPTLEYLLTIASIILLNTDPV